MSVPRVVVVMCPACDTYIEAHLCAWQLSVGEAAEGEKGIAVEMMAWAGHDCGGKK